MRTNKDKYISFLRKLASLVKINGTLLFADVTVESVKWCPYKVGDKEFDSSNISTEGIASMLVLPRG